MTRTATQRTSWLALAAIFALSGLTATRAVANDLGKILGGLAVGYVAYEVLDDLDDIKHQTRYRAPAHRTYRPTQPRGGVHRNYNPPSSYYHGGESKYWYKEGYKDGFEDGDRHGYNRGYGHGHQDGFRKGKHVGYDRGIRRGYKIGYGDGYDDGHYDGYRRGRRSVRW